ncbi:hypothetical protein DY000_02063323 [Brassica cretica]|uniref:Uncharacterized protein n=1 Tax=Brassica cretica TaxID=69181 RepID=A0ABQ7AVM9_BRACR|nr:hypothetical protein DY000_02063323 [Brassica cretica]
MAKEIAFDVTGNKISNSNGDTFILLIDHDIASISPLTSMLQQLSHKGLRHPELTLREGYGEEERERDLDGLETEREEDLELDRDDDLETEGERRPRL